MKAVRVHEPGGPEVLKLEEVPDLEPAEGQVRPMVRIAPRVRSAHGVYMVTQARHSPAGTLSRYTRSSPPSWLIVFGQQRWSW